MALSVALTALAGCETSEVATSPPESDNETQATRRAVISAEHQAFAQDYRQDMYAATAPLRGGALWTVIANLEENPIASDNERYQFVYYRDKASFTTVDQSAVTLCQLRGKDLHSAGLLTNTSRKVPPLVARARIPREAVSSSGLVRYEFQCGNLV